MDAVGEGLAAPQANSTRMNGGATFLMRLSGRRLRVALVVPLSLTMLVVAVRFGAVLPGFERLWDPHRPGGLDYSAAPGPVAPLTETFIDGVLGGDGDTSISSSDPGTPPPPGSVAAPSERTFVQHELTNDAPNSAYPISSVPFSASTSTEHASRTGEPEDCSRIGNTLWYAYRPKKDIGLVAYTFGSERATALGVFTRARDGWNLEVPCDTDEAGNALVYFPARAGRTYLFQVATPLGDGDVRFNLDPRGTLQLLSASPGGQPANANAWATAATPDGRFVVMQSDATNLTDEQVPSCLRFDRMPYSGRPGPCPQVFVRDADRRRTQIASTAASGEVGDGGSVNGGSISANGRYVAFESAARNLGPSDPAGIDLFVKDLFTGRVELIARGPLVEDGIDPGDAPRLRHALSAWRPSLSADGRFIAFQTPAGLVRKDTNGSWDVYVYDRATRRFDVASVSSDGRMSEPVADATDPDAGWLASAWSVDLSPSLSATGRFVVFRSKAGNLVPGDSNRTWDTFVHDRARGTTERISVSSTGAEADGPSVRRDDHVAPMISTDGRFAVFASRATNLGQPPDSPADSSPLTSRVFLRDRVKGVTSLVTAGLYPTISGNGRFISYSTATPRTDPLEGCSERPLTVDRASLYFECHWEVRVYDTWTDTTFPITVWSGGKDRSTIRSMISDDGRRVIFQSNVPGSSVLQVIMYEAARPW